MPSESSKTLISTVKVVVNGEVILCEPNRSFYIDENAEPFPEKWEILHNVYEGSTLVIHG